MNVTDEGSTATEKRKLIQMVKEGDARVAAAEKNHLNSVDHLISAGQMYYQAKEYGRSIGVTFPEALTLAESPVSERQAKQCITFANSDDPEQTVLAYRAKNMVEHARYRERLGKVKDPIVKARADAAIRNLPPEEPPQTERLDVQPTAEVAEERFGEIQPWEKPPTDIDPVAALMLRVKELNREDLVRFINVELIPYARACGLVKS